MTVKGLFTYPATEGGNSMSLIAFLAAKLPILAGAGILGVSLVGVCAGIIGATFTIEAELISAICAPFSRSDFPS